MFRILPPFGVWWFTPSHKACIKGSGCVWFESCEGGTGAESPWDSAHTPDFRKNPRKHLEIDSLKGLWPACPAEIHVSPERSASPGVKMAALGDWGYGTIPDSFKGLGHITIHSWTWFPNIYQGGDWTEDGQKGKRWVVWEEKTSDGRGREQIMQFCYMGCGENYGLIIAFLVSDFYFYFFLLSWSLAGNHQFYLTLNLSLIHINIHLWFRYKCENRHFYLFLKPEP